MSNHNQSSNPSFNNLVGIAVLILLLAIVPLGIGYIFMSIFRLSVWLDIFIVLASSIVICLSLVFLLGANFLLPDHLPDSY